MLYVALRYGYILYELLSMPSLFLKESPASFSTSALYGENCRAFQFVHAQGDCGSCMALASSTAYGMRACKLGLNRVPSHYLMLDCSTGDCVVGMGVMDVSRILLKGLPDVLDSPPAYAWGCKIAENLRLYKISHHSVVCSVKAIKDELMRGGPLVYAVQLSSSFLDYKGGVYSDTFTDALLEAPHAMVVTGWVDATHNESSYWTVWNSWSSEWGENGQARIDMHHTECMMALHVI